MVPGDDDPNREATFPPFWGPANFGAKKFDFSVLKGYSETPI